jgi:DNA-binding SARP family transcriptional activator
VTTVDFGVEVAVLGPVAVRGAVGPFHRKAALELVVFLAFHRDGVRYAACAAALWPDRAVSPSTVHSTASDARRALGRGADGSALLPRGAVLRLAETVITDAELFTAQVASGDPDDIVQAMHLVRGPLFAGLVRADWAVFDGTGPSVEDQVVRAALGAARALLHRGDPEAGEWVVRRALTCCPYDERLYRALLRAVAAQGDCVRLRSAMAQLHVLAGEAQIVRQTPGVMSALHPTTTDLYRELRHARAASGGYPVRL